MQGTRIRSSGILTVGRPSNREGWNRPLYWTKELDAEFTLGGQRKLDLNSPVTHVSYYEAFAYAKWAGARPAD